MTARLANVYRMRNPEKFQGLSLSEIRDVLGWSPVVSHSKHRYAIGVGMWRKRINKQLAAMALPYPKKEVLV